jgi:DNA-binding FadR family transcriptional regulator
MLACNSGEKYRLLFARRNAMAGKRRRVLIQAETSTDVPSPGHQALRPEKAAETVANTIRRDIIRGQLRDGDSLAAEAHLIAEFGVSRPTIREAIRILESEGLIAVSRGARGGARVSSPTFALVARAAGIALQGNGATLGDIYEMRTIIEPPVARMIAEKKPEEAAAVLQAQLDRELSLVDDRYAASQAIAEFHRIMIDLCDNVAIRMVGSALQNLVERHLALAQQREPSRDEVALAKRLRFGFRSHAKLIDLIRQGDGPGAEKHWLNHMRAAGVYWLAEVAPTTIVELLE